MPELAVAADELPTTMSLNPSLLKSATATDTGLGTVVAKLLPDEKSPLPSPRLTMICPGALLTAATISRLPSLLKSPTATELIAAPAPVSYWAALKRKLVATVLVFTSTLTPGRLPKPPPAKPT